MKQVILIGKTNVGKSLFLINFAEYMGYKSLCIDIEYPNRRIFKKEMSIKFARRYLSSDESFKTKFLQSAYIRSPFYRGRSQIKILDTSGMIGGIHSDKCVREGIVQTLNAMGKSDLIIHIVDVTDYIDPKKDNIDIKLCEYAKSEFKYVLLLNKIDLDKDGVGIKNLIKEFPRVKKFPISALNKSGFKDVKKFVFKNI